MLSKKGAIQHPQTTTSGYSIFNHFRATLGPKVNACNLFPDLLFLLDTQTPKINAKPTKTQKEKSPFLCLPTPEIAP